MDKEVDKVVDFLFWLTDALLFCFSPLIIVFSETVGAFKDSGGKEIKVITSTNDIGFFLLTSLPFFLGLAIYYIWKFKKKEDKKIEDRLYYISKYVYSILLMLSSICLSSMSYYIIIIMSLFVVSYALISIERFAREKWHTIFIHKINKIKIRIVYYFWWIISSILSYTTFLMSKSFEKKGVKKIFFDGWNQQCLHNFSVGTCIVAVFLLIIGIGICIYKAKKESS